MSAKFMTQKKNPAAVAMQKLSAKKRWSSKTKAERAEAMRKVVAARWAKLNKTKKKG